VRDAGRIRQAGFDVIGISPDKPSAQQKFDTKYGLGFRCFADEDHASRKASGLGREVDVRPQVHGPSRSAFLIDEAGKVAATWYGVSPKGHGAGGVGRARRADARRALAPAEALKTRAASMPARRRPRRLGRRYDDLSGLGIGAARDRNHRRPPGMLGCTSMIVLVPLPSR
jgi:peroxiredoxin Q/BCP